MSRSDPRLAPLSVILAALAALAVALASQYWGGLQPCVLCIYQRYPYVVIIALGVIGLLVARKPDWLRIVLVLAGLVFFLDAGIAFFHVGVEEKWWQGTSACGTTFEPGLTAEQLKELLLNQPLVRCDEVPWSLFGISMAGYNFIYAAMCGLITLTTAGRVNGAGIRSS